MSGCVWRLRTRTCVVAVWFGLQTDVHKRQVLGNVLQGWAVQFEAIEVAARVQPCAAAVAKSDLAFKRLCSTEQGFTICCRDGEVRVGLEPIWSSGKGLARCCSDGRVRFGLEPIGSSEKGSATCCSDGQVRFGLETIVHHRQGHVHVFQQSRVHRL
jgi:hypothetical protein